MVQGADLSGEMGLIFMCQVSQMVGVADLNQQAAKQEREAPCAPHRWRHQEDTW